MKRLLWVYVSGLFLADLGLAQMAADPSSITGGESLTRVGAGFTSSKIEYDMEDSEPIEIKRTVVTAEFDFGLSSSTDVFGQIGIITDSEIELESNDRDYTLGGGNGYVVGLGARSQLVAKPKSSVFAYGNVLYSTEEFDDKIEDIKVKGNLNLTEIHLGGAYNYNFSKTIIPYAAVDFTLQSDGESELKPKGRKSIKEDANRDDKLVLRLGSNFEVENALIRPEVAFIGEQTLSVTGSVMF